MIDGRSIRHHKSKIAVRSGETCLDGSSVIVTLPEAEMTHPRRQFLSTALKVLAVSALPTRVAHAAATSAVVPRPVRGRAKEVFERRMAATRAVLERPITSHAVNGDAERHDPAWVCYTKGLPHGDDGSGAEGACRQLWTAIDRRDAHALEDVPLGGYAKLANPQAAYAFDAVGPDSQQLGIAPPPTFSSAEQAAELVELYWHALTRDVPFDRFDTDPSIARACAELSALRGYTGPREGGAVTPSTVFRGNTRGGRVGPYVSQFLWRDLPWTPIRVAQLNRIAAPGKDYMTDWASWLAIQNGAVPPVNDYEATPRYIRTQRDLGEYVHRDFTYQAFLGACLMLFRMNAPLDGGFPYQYSISQSGFVTLGASDILHTVASVANIALKAAWFQKWAVHRRLRPEEYAARVHQQMIRRATFPLHADILNARATAAIFSRHGSYLLPQAYPEGAPLHPAFPSGHAVIAGACATALKACFAESFPIPNPQVPSEDGVSLLAYRGPALTVGNEIDKLAENMSIGRNIAGIHWRSDAIDGLALGEAIGIAVLKELRMLSAETVGTFTITKFDGARIEIA